MRKGTIKQPYLIGLYDGQPMNFAGLWERWRVPESIILPPEAMAPWLDGEEVALAPYPAGAMTARAVNRWVNNAAHDEPRCIEPLDGV